MYHEKMKYEIFTIKFPINNNIIKQINKTKKKKLVGKRSKNKSSLKVPKTQVI